MTSRQGHGKVLQMRLEVERAAAVTQGLVDAGADLITPPNVTPWDSLSARLQAPGGLQITLFQELTEREPT